MKFMLFPAVVVLAFGMACAPKKDVSTAAKADTKAAATAGSETKATEKGSAAATPVTPVTKDGITLLEAVACRAVEQREPVSPATKFPTDVGRLYIFSKLNIEGAAEGSIKHVWKFQGKDMATVTLPVRGPQWRTYSSKAVHGSQKGNWTVDILTAEGNLLGSVPFAIE